MKTLNAFALLVLLVSLLLLLGGCVGKNEGINWKELDFREGYTIAYLKGSDTLYTGKAVLWYENGQKEIETNFKDGKDDGPGATWYKNGQKMSEGNYKDGKIDGPVEVWHKNGQKKGEANWKDGEKISMKRWNEEGELIEETFSTPKD